MGTVFKFEFLTGIKKKAFIVTMSIMLLITLGFSFIPSIIGLFKGDNKRADFGFLSDLDYVNMDSLKDFSDYNFIKYDSHEELEEDIKSKKIEGGIAIYDGKRELMTNSTSLSNNSKYKNITDALTNIENENVLKNVNLPEDKIDEIIRGNKYETVTFAVDGAKNYWLAYFSIFIMYMLILNFGGQVAMSVAREKSDRTMELLITSRKPSDLIRGKVYANALIGILFIAVLIVGLFIGNKVGLKNAESGLISELASKVNVNMNQLIVTVSYFALGYIMYLFLFGSAASLVSKIEDVNLAIQPFMMVFVVAFLGSLFGAQNPGTLLRVLSFIPFTSPLAMTARYAVEPVSDIEVFISFAILLAFTVLVRILCVKIYRMGTLNYGTKPRFFKAMKQVFKREK